MDMTFTQMRDVLDRVRKTHREVSEICGRAKRNHDVRSGLLAEFFQHWEQRLGRCLDSLQAEERSAHTQRYQGFLETWVQFAGMKEIDVALDEVRVAEQGDTEELINKAFHLQEQLLKLLEDLVDRISTPEVKQKLVDLTNFEQQATRTLSSAMLTERDA